MPHEQSKCLYRNLIVIGCGPHYKKRYHEVLEKNGVSIGLLIDLLDKKETIEDFFQNTRLKPQKTLFLPEKYRNFISLQDIQVEVDNIIDLRTIDAVLLCTEPKVRKPYALWALSHRLPLFMDKPPCVFSDSKEKGTFLTDFEEMVEMSKKINVPVVVSCERRAHLGYRWLREYLDRFIQEEKAPITSIDIHFANGHCVTPEEYMEQEHHPFKYGYGLLFHSGYHYIDLLTSFLSLNKFGDLDFNLKFISVNPGEQLHIVQPHTAPFFPDKKRDKELQRGGETDFFLIGQASVCGNPRVHFSLKLVNTSISRRMTMTPSADASWRLRQEHVIIHLGYLASVHITSNPLKKLDPKNHVTDDFNVTLMHSPLLTKRDSLIKMDFSSFAQMYPEIRSIDSLNQYSREWQLKEFLQGRDALSSLSSHQQTVQILHNIYTAESSKYSAR